MKPIIEMTNRQCCADRQTYLDVQTGKTEKANRQIIGETYKQMRHEIFAIFRQMCIAEDTCEDLVQEVFLKLLSVDLIVAKQVRALAVTIAYQKRIDYLRHRAYINKVKNDGLWRMEQSYTNTEAEVNDILSVEMKAIRCMSVKDSRIYCMTRFEEKTTDEIVMETGLSKRAVESRIYRCRSMVRESVKRATGF
jgi:RNA polymerase sigma factor (sigma-70 family)